MFSDISLPRLRYLHRPTIGLTYSPFTCCHSPLIMLGCVTRSSNAITQDHKTKHIVNQAHAARPIRWPRATEPAQIVIRNLRSYRNESWPRWPLATEPRRLVIVYWRCHLGDRALNRRLVPISGCPFPAVEALRGNGGYPLFRILP